MPKQVLCILGPTCSGKTALAMQLFDRIPSELISVDSALVYKGMDIGTAKPEPGLLKQYPHHLVDIRDPSQPYSAAEFASDARKLIDDITTRHKLPILVGGTMLYFRALQQGLNELPAASASWRAKLEQRAAKEGWTALHAELAAIDPEAAATIKPTDPQRISRALEVYALTGMPLSTHWQQSREPVDLNFLNIGLVPAERARLHALINERFSTMMADGFLDEVRQLHARNDLNANLPAIKAVGYRQLWAYLEGECSLEEAQTRAMTATRQLAKRQLTWLRQWPELHVLDPFVEADLVNAALRSLNLK